MGRLPAADPVNPDPAKENRVTATAPDASPEQLNELMIGAIAAARPAGTSDPRVLEAIRAVPRHAFVPGASLADAYNPDLAVITKRDTGGRSLSCASVPSLVGAMLAQLDIRDGHRVFEAGAGTGWNAALLATLAGPGGHVTTIDIDPEITAQAAANLERAGFPGVHVATGDAGLGVPENAPYDRAIITIGSLDVPPERNTPERPASAPPSAVLCRALGGGQPLVFRDRPRLLLPPPLGDHVFSRRGRHEVEAIDAKPAQNCLLHQGKVIRVRPAEVHRLAQCQRRVRDDPADTEDVLRRGVQRVRMQQDHVTGLAGHLHEVVTLRDQLGVIKIFLQDSLGVLGEEAR